MGIVNGSLQEGYKDAAWFAANPTLVLLVGQKVNLEQTGTYKLGDGTTQLSALSFLGGSGSGLSGLTTNKVLKATSSTTAGDSNITDDGTTVIISTNLQVDGVIQSPNGLNTVTVVDTVVSLDFNGTTNSGYVSINDTRNEVKHDALVELNAPSVTKNGVEVATVNDIPSVAGLAPLASPTFTGTPLAPTASANTNNTQIATTAYVDGKSLFRTTTDSSTHTGTLTNTIIWSEDISNKLSSGDIADLISDVVRVSGSTSATIRYYLNSSASLSGATQIGLYYYGFSGLNIADFRRELIVKSSTVIRVKSNVSALLNDLSIFSNYADVTVNLASLHVIFAITLGNTGDQFLVSSRKMVK